MVSYGWTPIKLPHLVILSFNGSMPCVCSRFKLPMMTGQQVVGRCSYGGLYGWEAFAATIQFSYMIGPSILSMAVHLLPWIRYTIQFSYTIFPCILSMPSHLDPGICCGRDNTILPHDLA